MPELSEEQPNNLETVLGAYLLHIEELRKRLMLVLLIFIATSVASFWIAQLLIQVLTVPIGGLGHLQSIEVTENISVYMKVSILSGFILALPFITYELLAFIMPGLLPKEKRWIYWIIPMATLLFLSGVAFAYFVMLPVAIPFLIGFLGIQTTPRLANYFSFVTNLLFWMGAIFEMPLVIFVLAKLKIVNVGMLAKQWRLAVVISAVVAAVITPTVDPINMGLVMVPLLVLYLLSLLFALLAR